MTRWLRVVRGGTSVRWGLLLLAASACERRAPGLLECNAFGRRVLGVPQDAVVTDARTSRYLDLITAECTIVPCPRALLDDPLLPRCVRSHAGLEQNPRAAVRDCCSALERRAEERPGPK